MANTPVLAPENQFPIQAIEESIQVQPKPESMLGGGILTINLALNADVIVPWGANPVLRDQQLRAYWPSESFIAGAVASTSFRNSTADWRIKGPSEKVAQAVTDMLHRAQAGDMIGWVPFIQKLSQDMYTQDNGAFIELIRDPGRDANSKFKGAMAPVLGLAHVDAGACQRTGNAETPVLYTDLQGEIHKLKWFDVIPLSDFPSPIQRMNGVGVCALSRALRMSQIIRSIAIFKHEEVDGRNIKKINIVGGVSNSQIDQAVKRTIEKADNRGSSRFIEHVVLASLDPEKPVSNVVVELASLPEGFDYDNEMQWFIACLALDFGVDYQEFAPLSGGAIGSASQSDILNRKSSGKGPRVFMDSTSRSLMNYGVLPRGYTQVFDDKVREEEVQAQEVRTRASEEAAIIVNSKIFPPDVVAKMLVRRGVYEQADIDATDAEWWKNALEAASNEAKGQMVGARGGNTILENAGRTNTGKPNQTAGARLRKQ